MKEIKTAMEKRLIRKGFNLFRLSQLFFLAPIILALAVPFAGAQDQDQQQTETPTVMSPPMQAVPAAAGEYRIQVGDELEIKSFYNPELNERVIVRPDGRISVQLAPEIVAAGRTPAELASALTERYSANFKQPEISVILRTFAGQRVFVAGEVQRPQMILMAGPMTVLQAVAAAEGFTDTARTSEVILIRRAADRRPSVSIVDAKAAYSGDDATQDVMLQPFDIVYVPRSRISNVNRFVDQFIRRNIPLPFSLSYRIDPRDPGE
jgi:polysaccharide export outer membrane protein